MANEPGGIVAASRELMETYKLWQTRWPDTLTNPTRKAFDQAWWDKGAEICVEHSMSGAMLFWCVYRYANARPEDMAIEFQPTVFRSHAILRRSVQNFRDVLRTGAESLEVLHLLRNHNQVLVSPRGTSALLRTLSKLAVDYFAEKVNVRAYGFARTSASEMSPNMRDTLRFSLCGANPFLLMRVAETQKIREMAMLNGRVLAEHMPWVRDVWEHLLPEGWDYAPIDEAKFFSGGQAHYCWPLDPWNTPYFVGDRTPPRPVLPLFEGLVDRLTDSYLQSLLDQSKKGR